MKANIFGSVLTGLVYPDICVFCGAYSRLEYSEREKFNKCLDCVEKLTDDFENYCVKCFLPVGKEHNALDCTSCRNRSIHYDELYFINEYKTYVGDLVLQFKYGKDRFLALCLSELLSHRVININGAIDIIIPVPMFWVKKMLRGFNQAELIAYELSIYLDKPLQTNVLKRKKPGKKQAGQSRTSRRQNAKNLYSVIRSIAGQNILLVDDVVTTGSTLSECAKLLKDNGANKVIGAALAGVQRAK